MSRTRVVSGCTKIFTKGKHFLHSDNDIVFSSSKKIHETGKEKGIIYGSKIKKIDSTSIKSDFIEFKRSNAAYSIRIKDFIVLIMLLS